MLSSQDNWEVLTKVLSTHKGIPQSCTLEGFSQCTSLPNYSLAGVRRIRDSWGHSELDGSTTKPPCSPGQVWPIPQPRGDELHPLLILTKANDQPQAMCQLPLPTAPALLPAPFPCPQAHRGLATNKHKMFRIFCTRSSGTGCAFPCLLRHFWFPQQLRYRTTR